MRFVATLGHPLAPESFLKNPIIILCLILRLAGSTCALPASRQFGAACAGEKNSSQSYIACTRHKTFESASYVAPSIIGNNGSTLLIYLFKNHKHIFHSIILFNFYFPSF